MSPEQSRKSLKERIEEDPGKKWELIWGEIQRILDQAPLNPGHPLAAQQATDKADAKAALDRLNAQLPDVVKLALVEAQKIIDRPHLPVDDPNAAALIKQKQEMRTMLMSWQAHYGPGGPHEGRLDKEEQ